MKQLMIDGDSKKGFPNLALMKLSAHLKAQGHTIDLIKGIPTTIPLETYDSVYVSCIFYQNADRVREYMKQFPKETKVTYGGSGFKDEYHIQLDDAIEHIMPDYDLYDVDFSMGFTSRGCIRKCPWCIVPLKEGTICDHARITEFLDSRHKKLILLDNNFQSSPRWRENIQYLIDNKIRVNFNQGLDARLVTKEFADLLAETKCYAWNFKTLGAHLAFDTLSMEKPLRKAIALFDDAGMAPKRFIVYILVGHSTTYKQDLDRITKVRELGAVPYIMIFNKKQDTYLRHLARWINRKYYEWVPMEEYKDGVLKQ